MFKIFFLLIFLTSITFSNAIALPKDIERAIENSLKTEILDIWYPLCMDKEYGGFLCDFSYDWKEDGQQDKMIVTQARHLWTTSETALYYKDENYSKWAAHGFKFLKDKMWDIRYGGFFERLNQKGEIINDGIKFAYGNAFAIYGLSSYYNLTGDTSVLNLAKMTFHWLEKYNHDPEFNGYYNYLNRDGSLPTSNGFLPSDQKDQNSSIHLLEAFTNLYQIWPDTLLRKRLQELYDLILDTIVGDKNYLTLFMQRDWTPISLIDVPESQFRRMYYFDHVSFGHDVETAFLMLEAYHTLNHHLDQFILMKAKRMVDHALDNGWDKFNYGFFDGGYYFKNSDTCTVINEKKIWWVQAEGLNALLLMSRLFPDEEQYFETFKKQWQYIDEYLVDHKYRKGHTQNKGYDWKANYHNFRALLNSVKMLKDEFELITVKRY
ncbi:MAG: AGE family epimerase/isomerase [Calditrichaceae bacterium]